MAPASQKDFVSGLMFMAVGGGFAWGAVDYEIGEAARMGPGYFPFMLGMILLGLGALVAFNGFKSGPPDGDRIGAIDGQGRWLLAAGQASHQLALHRIDPASGALTLQARQPVGEGAMWVRVLTLAP